jgi:hypothetical protein
METIIEIAVKIFVEAILISGILGYFFSKREERMKKTIEEEFGKRDKFFDARFNFKLRALEERLYRKELEIVGSLN